MRLTHHPFCLGLIAANAVRKRIVYIRVDVIVLFFKDYMIYCGLWLCDAADKYQSSLCKCFPPVYATYCASIYTYIIH